MRCAEPEWSPQEDWALQDQVKAYSAGTGADTATFWSALAANVPALSARDSTELEARAAQLAVDGGTQVLRPPCTPHSATSLLHLHPRPPPPPSAASSVCTHCTHHPHLSAARGEGAAATPCIPPASLCMHQPSTVRNPAQPDLLEAWERLADGRYAGSADGRPVWLTVSLEGRLPSDPREAPGYIEALGGRIYELGAPGTAGQRGAGLAPPPPSPPPAAVDALGGVGAPVPLAAAAAAVLLAGGLGFGVAGTLSVPPPPPPPPPLTQKLVFLAPPRQGQAIPRTSMEGDGSSRGAAWSKLPGLAQPPLWPPAAPEAHPLAQGCLPLRSPRRSAAGSEAAMACVLVPAQGRRPHCV